MWSGIFGFITTVSAGLIVGVFTSSFLKKREERIRVSGLIFEKRVEVQRQLSSLLFKKLLFDSISVNDPDILNLLEEFDIADAHSGCQRSAVFDSVESCATFIRYLLTIGSDCLLTGERIGMGFDGDFRSDTIALMNG